MKFINLPSWFGRKHLVSFLHLRERLLSCVFAVQLIILFILPALRSAGWGIPHSAIYCVLLFLVFLAALLSRSLWAILSIGISLCLTVCGIVWRLEDQNIWSQTLNFVGQLLTQISLLWIVSTAVFGPGRVTFHRILGAVVMYLCIGMIFATIDIFITNLIPTAFTNIPADHYAARDMLSYFSFSALTTCSFGDIAPVHPIARVFSTIEAIIGQLFPPIFIARIVNQHGISKAKK